MKKGQALVMVLLVLGIATTIGLSVVSRSVTDVSVSSTQDESSKALEAAEAGVERALGGVIPDTVLVPGTVGTGNQTQRYQVQTRPLGQTYYEIPYKVDAGDTVSLDLANYSGSTVCVYWGDIGVSPTGIEAILYYDSGTGAIRMWKGAYSTGGNGGFDSPSGGSCPSHSNFNSSNRQFLNLSTITGAVGRAKVLRVKMIFSTTPQPMAFDAGGSTFPPQGRDILSTGQAGSSTQKLRVIQADPDTSSMFDAALFSGTKLVQ